MLKLLKLWTCVLMGLFVGLNRCDARAVNISNTWTMPQEGLNVFYRFFRDKISWFEADAVCQFHHANLATVDNSFQFDATGDLLKELEVNDIVWIGLMRPQNSERFMWSTSGPLATDTGYWADSLPLIDAPLCAVIDPIRDYRWHALRCGGPETASFLCEMSVPRWAEACVIKDTPTLTIQYMADTASIELIKDCGEEGIKREMCRGKQDRERLIRELRCKNERVPPKQPTTSLLETHYKSLQKMMKVASDNNEDNSLDKKSKITKIEEMPIEKNSVQKLIEQFNVEDIMQNEQHLSGYHIPGEIPKPVKKVAKKAMSGDMKKDPILKKLLNDKPKVKKPIVLEDMMMGDQPFDDNDNEIMQPIPHIKKVLPHDYLKFKETLTTVKPDIVNQIKTSTTIVSSTHSNDETSTISNINQLVTQKDVVDMITATVSPQVEMKPATIGHPMHPQQPRSTIITEETTHPHIKETNDNHFIPPMLLVKSHYQPPKPHERQERPETTTTEHFEITTKLEEHNNWEDKTILDKGKINNSNKSTANIDSTLVSTSIVTTDEPFANEQIQTTTLGLPTPLIKDDNHHAQMNIETLSIAFQTTTSTPVKSSSFTAKPSSVGLLISTEPPLTVNEPKWTTIAPTEILTTTMEATTTTHGIDSIQEKITNLESLTKNPDMNNGETATTIVNEKLPTTIALTTIAPKLHSIPSTTATTTAIIDIKTNETVTTTTDTNINTKTDTNTNTNINSNVNVNNGKTIAYNENNNNNNDDKYKKTAEIVLSSTTAATHHDIVVVPKTTEKITITKTTPAATEAEVEAIETTTPITPSSPTPSPPQNNNFSEEDNFQPFKPNRRRSLTKPETASYFKKILG